MINIFIDTETVPSQSAGVLEEIRANIKPPAHYSKPDTIAKWYEENRESAADEQYRKTALNGTQGEIVAIGYAIDNEPAQVLYRDLSEPEAGLLSDFFSVLRPDMKFIGHNILSFDLRFLFQRAVINGIEPLYSLRQDTRVNGEQAYDTMQAWAGYGNRVSLANLCKALNIPVKNGDITGATVWDAVKSGRIKEVAEYCKSDVEATRAAYKRLTFQN